jgi:TolB protein
MAESATCPFCGNPHPVEAIFCPEMGKPLPAGWAWGSPPAQKPRLGLWLGLGLLLILVAGGVFLLVRGLTGGERTTTTSPGGAGEPRVGWLMSATPAAAETLSSTAGIDQPAATLEAQFTQVAGAATLNALQTQAAQATTQQGQVANQYTATVAALLTQSASQPTALPTATPPVASNDPLGKIAYTCQVFRDEERNQICIINADGSGETRLTREDNVNHSYPWLAPDGQRVVYARGLPVNGDLYETDLAGNTRQLTSLPGNEYAPSISPDGQQIVFVYNDSRHQTLWMMNRDGGNLRQLTDGSDGEAWDPVWSPDGQEILFARGTNVQLYILNLYDLSVRRVSNLADLRGRSDWSPDGQQIATYAGPSGDRQIVTFDTAGENVLFLTAISSNLAPNYSPDGGWIAFTSYMGNPGDLVHGCEIYLMRLADLELVRLTQNNFCDFQPNWGP